MRLTVAAGFGDEHWGDLDRAVREVARLGPRARAAAPALLRTLADLERGGRDGPDDADEAVAALGADAVPASSRR